MNLNHERRAPVTANGNAADALLVRPNEQQVQLTNPAPKVQQMQRHLLQRHRHAKLITTAWQKSVAGIVEAGLRLIDAKNELEHGEFLAMVKNDLPFGQRTAQYLMAIAKHRVLSNPQRFAYLPPCLSTLSELSRLPHDLVEQFMLDNTVSAELTLAQAKGLVARHCFSKSGKINLKGRPGLPGVQRRFSSLCGRDMSVEEAWQKQVLYDIGQATNLAQRNRNGCFPLCDTYKVTPEILKAAKTLKPFALNSMRHWSGRQLNRGKGTNHLTA
jgi:hypothetical protein